MDEREVLNLVRKYNVLKVAQVYSYFEAAGTKPKAVGQSLGRLEKKRRIVRNEAMGMVATNQHAYDTRECDNLAAFDVLLDIMNQQGVSEHYLAEKADYPARIIFIREGEMYDILVINEDNVNLANHVYGRKGDGYGKHIVTVPEGGMMERVEIPNVIAFCIRKGDGEIEYYYA